MNRVVHWPARNVGWVTTLSRNGMFVFTPRMRNSCKRPLHPPGRVLEPAGVGRDLDQQRIIERRDDRARRGRAAVEPEARAAGRAIMRDPAVVGSEVVGGVLGRDPALDRVPLRLDRLLAGEADLRIGQLASLGDQDLALDEVDAGDDLGDGVLDLEPGIDLDEVERAGLVIDQELDRPGVLVADLPADRQGGLADGLAERRVEVEGRGDLDDLLVPPLDRAIALVEVDEVAVPIAQKLDLDVLGAADELLEEDIGAAERGLGLAPGLVERRVERVRTTRRPACPVRRRPSPP